MATLNGLFTEPKPHKINYVKENKKKLRQISSVLSQNSMCSRRINIGKSLSAQSHLQTKKYINPSPGKNRTGKKSSGTGCKIGHKEDMAVFIQDKDENEGNSEVNSLNIGVNTSPRCRRTSLYVRNQSVQTIDPNKFDQLFHVGVIRYPSAAVKERLEEIEKQKANRLDVHIKKDIVEKNKKAKSKISSVSFPNQPKSGIGAGGGDTESKENEKVSFIDKANESHLIKEKDVGNNSPNLNAVDIIQQATESQLGFAGVGAITKRSNLSSDRSTYDPPPSYKRGEVPRYLKERQQKKLDEKKKKEEIDPDCPPGHIPLPDEERKNTLHMLRASYAESIRELNQLPVRSDTLRIRQKKCDLEQKLSKLEEGIKVFNKSKVYVKID